MTGFLSSSRRPPCGSWSVSLGIGGRDAMRKNIRIIECFGVFSQVIAFAGIESRFAAARTIFPERRTADAAATLTRVQGETSTTEVARPMSRRQIRERRELSLPPSGPDWRFDSRHGGAIPSDFTLRTDSCGLATAVGCGIQEAPRCWARERVGKPVLTPPSQTAGPPHAEVLDANGFFASLVLRRVRARDSSVSHPEQPDCSSDHRKPGPVSAAASDVCSLFAPRSRRPVTTAGADSPDPAAAPLETQLAELAWRRLRGRAAGERP
jgi:hypothetical protein